MEYIPNDVSIKLESYLIDSDNQVYINPNTLVIDSFTVQIYKSSLPTSNQKNYLTVIVSNAISTKYNKSSGGFGIYGSNILSQLTSTSELLPGLGVSGLNIPDDTIITNIRDTTSVEISQNFTATGSTTVSFSANKWVIDYSAIDELVTIVNFNLL